MFYNQYVACTTNYFFAVTNEAKGRWLFMFFGVEPNQPTVELIGIE